VAFIALKLCNAKNKFDLKLKRNNNLWDMQVITQNLKFIQTKSMQIIQVATDLYVFNNSLPIANITICKCLRSVLELSVSPHSQSLCFMMQIE
jgi:hypothetical protein